MMWFKNLRKRGRSAGEEDEEDVFTKAKRALTSVFRKKDHAGSPSPPFNPSPPLISLLHGAVRKLYDGDEYIGTFVFLSDRVGVCCFHAVLFGTTLRENSLSVDGDSLQHIVSYPYYDISFYYCLGSPHKFLTFEVANDVVQGTEVIMASFPAIYSSEKGSELDDEPDLAYGRVCRRLPVGKQCFMVGADYICFPGSSGGAVVNLDGKLLGVYIECVYYEAAYHERGNPEFRMEDNRYSRHLLEHEAVEFPCLDWPGGRKASKRNKKWTDLATLAGYAAYNVRHKSFVASFLPVMHIRAKFQSAQTIVRDRILASTPVELDSESED